MYSRKGIEMALKFAAGEAYKFSLCGLQFRADGSIEATDGHKLIVVPPQAERHECPKPYKKTRGDVWVPRDTVNELLRRTKGKGRRSVTWYGVEAGKRQGSGVLFSWGEFQERMEFAGDAAKFPDIRRVTVHLPQTPTFKVCMGIDTMEEIMQAARGLLECKRGEHRGGVTFEFSAPDAPVLWRVGGSFGAIMPMRLDKDDLPGEYEKAFRNYPAVQPESKDDLPATAEPNPEPTPAPQPVDPVEARDPETESYLVTVQYQDIYDMDEDGREYSSDEGYFRHGEAMTAEEVVAEIKAGGFAILDAKGPLPTACADPGDLRMIYYGEEDMFGHTVTKFLTLAHEDDLSPAAMEEWRWLMDQAGVSLGGWAKAA